MSLHYYLDKTKDLRAGKELVFVSFRKSFNEDIVPVTVSLAQTLHQVRTHDVRAFAASKAFQSLHSVLIQKDR